MADNENPADIEITGSRIHKQSKASATGNEHWLAYILFQACALLVLGYLHSFRANRSS